MSWRVARSLLTLRDQINTAYPRRSKLSDGTIGDTAHQNRSSDHNPWYGPGIVTAMDITHDPANGVDIDRLTDDLAASRDPRIKYVIANRLIMSGAGGPRPWVWRSYSGSNPHSRHFHLSVVASPLCDDPRSWNLPSLRVGGGANPPIEENDMQLTDKITLVGGKTTTVGALLAGVANDAGSLKQNIYYGGGHKSRFDRLLEQVAALNTSVAGLTKAVAALSDDSGLTEERVEQIIRDAVQQHIQITGEVRIGAASEGNES